MLLIALQPTGARSPLRIVAVGTRFFPYPHPGDKTFWLNLFQRLGSKGHEFYVLNVDRRAKPVERLGPNLTIETVPAVPIYFRGGPQAARYNRESLDIAAITNYASKTLTLPGLLRRASRRASQMSADVVHFIDNMGPFGLAAARGLPVPCTVSAITYDPRQRGYDPMLRLSVQGFRRVAASSDTFRQRLIALGVPEERIASVRWGADAETFAPRAGGREARRALGLDPSQPVVMWAGYIQQTTEADFRLAYRAVEEVQQERPDVAAWFCFKPAHFRDSFRALDRPGRRCVGDPDIFDQVRRIADLMISPVSRGRSILAPPLTWAESFLQGTPILTTPCGGAEETLGPGRGGEVAPALGLGTRLGELLADRVKLSRLQETTRSWGVERYSLDQSASSFLQFWESALRR